MYTRGTDLSGEFLKRGGEGDVNGGCALLCEKEGNRQIDRHFDIDRQIDQHTHPLVHDDVTSHDI